MNSSYDLWLALYKLDLLKDAPKYWLPHVGELDVLVGVVLFSQTKWEKVEVSLSNLHNANLLSLESLASTSIMIVQKHIQPSGYVLKKSQTLQLLCQAILESFGDFEGFKSGVCREWLLSQKGISPESADRILCYACERDVMVAGTASNTILKSLNYEFESYDALQEWLLEGVEMHFDKISSYYSGKITLFTIISRFHGKMVEYSKMSDDKRGSLFLLGS